MGWIEDVNVKVATSVVGKWFRLDGSGHVGPLLFIITFLVLYYSVSGNVCCLMFPMLDAGSRLWGSNSELRHDITYSPVYITAKDMPSPSRRSWCSPWFSFLA